VQRALTDFGADESFEKASQKLLEHYGIIISDSTIRRIVEKHGCIMQQIQKSDIYSTRTRPAKTIIGEIDGSMVPTVTPSTDASTDKRKNKKLEWKEARLSLAYVQGSVTPFYAGLIGSTDEAGECLARVVKRSGQTKKTKCHFVADGAVWIADKIENLYGSQAALLLDFYHVSEYLAAAAECCSRGSVKEWLERQQDLLKKGHIDQVLSNLQPDKTQCLPHEDKCPAAVCHGYLSKRIHQLGYKEAIEADLPIGSGKVEGSHKSIIQKRLKIPGAWWLTDNINNMLGLRTLRANGDWNNYWNAYQGSTATVN
jgi:hypothetical protein